MMPGRRIIQAAWATTLVYAVVTVPATLGVDALDGAEIVVSLVLFAVSIPVWCWAFGLAVLRTTRGDNVVVANLFFLQGSAPKDVRRQLFAALALNVVVVAATAYSNPFGVLVPMLPLGLIGLWAARHGIFPPREMDRPRGS